MALTYIMITKHAEIFIFETSMKLRTVLIVAAVVGVWWLWPRKDPALQVENLCERVAWEEKWNGLQTIPLLSSILPATSPTQECIEVGAGWGKVPLLGTLVLSSRLQHLQAKFIEKLLQQEAVKPSLIIVFLVVVVGLVTYYYFYFFNDEEDILIMRTPINTSTPCNLCSAVCENEVEMMKEDLYDAFGSLHPAEVYLDVKAD